MIPNEPHPRPHAKLCDQNYAINNDSWGMQRNLVRVATRSSAVVGKGSRLPDYFGRVWSIISLWVPALTFNHKLWSPSADCLGYSAAVSVLDYTSISDTCNNSYVCVCVTCRILETASF